jgi:hypothetical protein
MTIDNVQKRNNCRQICNRNFPVIPVQQNLVSDIHIDVRSYTDMYCPVPITVAVWSKIRSNTRIVGSSPAQDMDICVYSVCR